MRNQEPMRVRALDLFLDSDGLIRSRGRLNRSSHLAYEVKNPILLGKHHPVTKLVIVDCHVKCSHLGTGATLAELRQSGYWVPQGRQAVNKVLASCARCKRYNSRPVLPNAEASLPAPRADFEVPFQHTGVDFTGHVWGKGWKFEPKNVPSDFCLHECESRPYRGGSGHERAVLFSSSGPLHKSIWSSQGYL